MTAPKPARVPIHPEAFSRDLRTRGRHPRQQSYEHLRFIRTLPCVLCGTYRHVQAAHVRARNVVYGKRSAGAGEKPDDKFVLPMCRDHHAEQHRGDELAFWHKQAVDPFAVALTLWAHSGDVEACELALTAVRSRPDSS